MTDFEKRELDQRVSEYCQKYKLTYPSEWCYPGDLIYEDNGAIFICGDDPADVAELRRRGKRFKKVDVEALKKFLIEQFKKH